MCLGRPCGYRSDMTDGTRVIKRAVNDITTIWINLIIIVIIGLIVLFLEIFGLPSHRGFFCDDDTIKYPYEKNTISEGALVLAGILVPYTIITATVIWTIGFRARVAFWRYEIPEWLTQSGTAWGSYIVGFGLCQIISNAGKFTIGRLRPHFLAVCKVNVECGDPLTNEGYILEYVCSGNPNQVLEARMSFPSGHASVSFFAAIYTIMYIQNSRKWGKYGFVRGICQFTFVLVAWWVSLTRIMDYWHHWSDVLAGAVLGIISAYLTGKHLPGINKDDKHKYEECIPLQTTSHSSRNSSNIP